MRVIVLVLVVMFLFVGACSNKSAENPGVGKDGAASGSTAGVKASELIGTYKYSAEDAPLRGTETVELNEDGTASYTLNVRGDEQQVKGYDKNILEKTGTYEVTGQTVRTNIVINLGQDAKEFNFQGVSGANPAFLAGLVMKFLDGFFPASSPTTLELQIKGTQLSIGSRTLSKE